MRNPAQAPNKKRHLCVPPPSAQITPYSRGGFLHRPNFLFAERCSPSIHPSIRSGYYTHTYYSLLISRRDRQSGAAESALYTNHFIAGVRVQYFSVGVESAPSTPDHVVRCTTTPPPPPAGRGCTATHYAASASERPTLIAPSTIARRGKSWKKIIL